MTTSEETPPPEAQAATPAASGERWGALGGFLLASFYLWVAAWLIVFVAVPVAVARWDPVIVTSGSMAPLVQGGDVVLLTGVDDTLAPGTVVAYDDPAQPGTLTLHRIIGVHPNGDYRTKGDANAAPDSTPLPPERIEGVGRLLVPVVGLPAHWLRTSPPLFVGWAAVTLAAIALAATPPPAGGSRSPSRVRRAAGRLGATAQDAVPAVLRTRLAAMRSRRRVKAIREGRCWAPAAGPASSPAQRRARRLRELTPPVSAFALPPLVAPTRLGLLLALTVTSAVILLDPRGPEIPVGRWQRQLARRTRVLVAHATLVRGLLCLLALAALVSPAGVRGMHASAALSDTTANTGSSLYAGDWDACLGTQTDTVPVIADTYVAQDEPTRNFGSAGSLLLRSEQNANARLLLRFDMPDVPSDCPTMEHATLQLYNETSTALRSVTVHRLDADFGEHDVTWQTQPDPLGPPSHGSAGSGGWVTIDVTGTIERMINEGNSSVSVRDTTEGADPPAENWYTSREGDPARAPRLVVEWGP